MFFNALQPKNGKKIKLMLLINWLQWRLCIIVLDTVLVWIDMFLVIFREDFHLILHALMYGEF